MKREDPAAHLVERAIHEWQLRESSAPHARLPDKPAGSDPDFVPLRTGISAITVGAVGGFLGAITSLAFNTVGAWAFGIEQLRLLRIYATIIEGRAALDMTRSDFFVAAFVLHLVIGLFFGAGFALGARRLCCAGLRSYVSAGIAYGIAVWLLNFYGILSWLQPLLYGESLILTEIPIAVAALTHISYGLTVALVTYPFQRDFVYESLDRLKKEE